MILELESIELKSDLYEHGIVSKLCKEYLCIRIGTEEASVNIEELENALRLFKNRS